jgi:hypothetical protein
MFLKHSIHVNFEKPQRCVEGVVVTHNNGIVIFTNDLKETVLHHYSNNGVFINHYMEKTLIMTFGSVVSNDVLYLMPALGQIGFLNVDNRTKTNIKFAYLSESVYKSKLFIFSESQHYCIFERNDNELRLTFIKYPQTIVYTHTVKKSNYSYEF